MPKKKKSQKKTNNNNKNVNVAAQEDAAILSATTEKGEVQSEVTAETATAEVKQKENVRLFLSINVIMIIISV